MRSAARTRFMISCRLPGENQILNVRSENGGSVGRSGFLNVAKDLIAEAITVREDFLESHRGERPARGQLNIPVKTVLKTHHGMKCCGRVGDEDLHHNADTDGHLVGGEDFLALDSELALTDVDEDDLDSRTAVEAKVQVAAACSEPAQGPALARRPRPQPAVCRLTMTSRLRDATASTWGLAHLQTARIVGPVPKSMWRTNDQMGYIGGSA